MKGIRRHAISIVLVFFAIAAAVYVLVIDRGTVSDSERELRVNTVFPAFRREDLRRIDLAQGDAHVVLLRGDAEDGGELDWRLAPEGGEPAETADIAQVFQLLSQIEFASRIRSVDDGDYGFDTPRVRGEIDMGEVTYRFALGAPAPRPEGAAYFRLDGDGAFVVKKELTAQLLKPRDSYRERSFIPYLSTALAKLEIRGAGSPVLLERMNRLDFRVKGRDLRASRSVTNRLWRAFAEMRAEKFLGDAEADQALGAPTFTVVMTPADASKPAGELVVGGACPGQSNDVVAVRRAPAPRVSACVPKGVLEGLGVTADELVDRGLFSEHGDEMGEIKLSWASGTGDAGPNGIEIARMGVGWHQRSPLDRALAGAEAEAANALAETIASAKGEGVRKAAQGEPWKALARIEVTRVEGKAPEVVELGVFPEAPSAPVAAKRLVDDGVVLVPRLLADLLLPREVAVRALPVWTTPLDKFPIAGVATTCGARPQDLAHDDQGWASRSPPDRAVDTAAAVRLYDAVVHAKAEAWVSDELDPRFGFDKGCKVSVSFVAEGSRTRTILFGAEAGKIEGILDAGGVFAHVEGERAVFIADEELLAAAKASLVTAPAAKDAGARESTDAAAQGDR